MCHRSSRRHRVKYCVTGTLELGAKRLLFFSAAISAESIHSQYDIPELVDEATFPEGFEAVNLGAWDNDPLVIAAIKERIDAQGVHQE